MTTKTTITLSPIKRCYTSPNLKNRRMISRKYQTNLSLTIPNMISSPTTITVSCEKQNNLPDLLNDVFIEQQRRKTIVHIATILRKVGDQMNEQLQVTSSSSSNQIFGQRTTTFVYCLSHVLRFFL
jgi:hypothetical protein